MLFNCTSPSYTCCSLSMQLREACPPHKQKDLAGLVKALKSDEVKIRQRIDEWWDEPIQEEEQWEDVNKKSVKRQQSTGRGSRGRGRGSREGRGGGRGRESRGTGRGRDGGGRGRDGRGRGRSSAPKTREKDEAVAASTPASVPAPTPAGSWAKKEAPETAAPAVSDPTPVAPKPVAAAAAGTGGNVWATKGSAYLIQKENAPPPPPPKPEPVAPPSPALEPASSNVPSSPAPPPVTQRSAASGAWGKGRPTEKAPTDPVAETASAPLPPKEAIPTPAKEVPVPPQPSINMGRWKQEETDDANLDFGFGSFGDGAEAPTQPGEGENNAAASSPARPPPGLSIGGMPPMPNAVSVSELEDKLEDTKLTPAPETKPVSQGPAGYSYANPYGTAVTTAPAAPGMGMYNSYNPTATGAAPAAPSNGGFGVQAGGAGAPILGGPASIKPTGTAAALYGQQNAGTASTTSESTPAAATGGMPPGMAGMPYGGQMYYQQPAPFHMGQHQPNVGYNYAYNAQFAGSQFGYPGNMGGYQPHYGDQQQQQQQPQQQHEGGSNSGGYQKNNYRGNGANRGNNNGNGQYQAHYNPQGGYGGQPAYGIGYQNDHFQQRGYQHGGVPDPYGGMPQQSQPQSGNNYGGGFQGAGDDHYKGKKPGGRPFQQGGPQQPLAGGQQAFGLQGQGAGSGADANQWPSNDQPTGGWGGSGPNWQK